MPPLWTQEWGASEISAGAYCIVPPDTEIAAIKTKEGFFDVQTSFLVLKRTLSNPTTAS
jgi:hypothetical protein